MLPTQHFIFFLNCFYVLLLDCFYKPFPWHLMLVGPFPYLKEYISYFSITIKYIFGLISRTIFIKLNYLLLSFLYLEDITIFKISNTFSYPTIAHFLKHSFHLFLLAEQDNPVLILLKFFCWFYRYSSILKYLYVVDK